MANEIYCPHCKKELRDVWELFTASDGNSEETATVTCEKCGKEFTVVQRLTVEYSVQDSSESKGTKE